MATMYNYAIIKDGHPASKPSDYKILGKWQSSKVKARKLAMKYAITHIKKFDPTSIYPGRGMNGVWIISNETYSRLEPSPRYDYHGGIPLPERTGLIIQNSWDGKWEFISYQRPTANVHYDIAFDGSITRRK